MRPSNISGLRRAETAVHTVRAWLVRNSGASGKILVKLDLQRVQQHFPPRCDLPLPCPCSLGGVVLPCANSPLLWGARCHSLGQELRAGPLDDGGLAGDIADVVAALKLWLWARSIVAAHTLRLKLLPPSLS